MLFITPMVFRKWKVKMAGRHPFWIFSVCTHLYITLSTMLNDKFSVIEINTRIQKHLGTIKYFGFSISFLRESFMCRFNWPFYVSLFYSLGWVCCVCRGWDGEGRKYYFLDQVFELSLLVGYFVEIVWYCTREYIVVDSFLLVTILHILRKWFALCLKYLVCFYHYSACYVCAMILLRVMLKLHGPNYNKNKYS